MVRLLFAFYLSAQINPLPVFCVAVTVAVILLSIASPVAAAVQSELEAMSGVFVNCNKLKIYVVMLKLVDLPSGIGF
ncbi:hypothetical protein [Donghicola tyrosinivorans]|uniref:hypothetical protein n=1 Tax=Donghicola tyrosinivorans TaxID=1652492 RepID=UPI0011B2902F|nr:hypothetical protein [Donghicola tyrosinivorans]